MHSPQTPLETIWKLHTELNGFNHLLNLINHLVHIISVLQKLHWPELAVYMEVNFHVDS